MAEVSPDPKVADAQGEADTTRFLLDLAIALHRFSMYPAGHPALNDMIEVLARRAGALFSGRQRIAIGVAKDRLVVEGIVTDANHPLLRGLADRLHRHHLSALSIYQGVTAAELADAMATMAAPPERDGPIGSRVRGIQQLWPHIGLHPLTAGDLEMAESDGDGDASRCAGLWVGLAQAALGRSRSDAESAVTEPTAVAHAIDAHQPAEAYDQVLVGYLQQIAEELKAARGPETVELRRRVSTLVSTMNPATLRRLLRMGGNTAHRTSFVRAATAGLGAVAVVDLVRAAAEASREELSTGLVRLLSKLANHADAGTPPIQALADSALRAQVARLLSGWNLPDPNPQDHSGMLRQIASRQAGSAPAASRKPVAERTRLLEIALEVDAEGPMLWQAVDQLIDEGQMDKIVALARPHSAAGGVATSIWKVLSSVETVRRLLARVPPDFASLDALKGVLSAEALGPLFDVLSNSADRRDRRAAFDRLRSFGRPAAEAAIDRLGDDRWFVVRNMLALLAEIEDIPPWCDPWPLLSHAEPRVRREALRVALRLRAVRAQAVAASLTDPDDRVLRAAVKAAATHPYPSAAALLLGLARRDIQDDGLHAEVLQALALASRGRSTRDHLLAVAARETRRSLWPGREAPTTRAGLAALSALAAHWPRDPQVLDTLRRAERSSDPDVRQAVQGRHR